jgi:hypothetical protein
MQQPSAERIRLAREWWEKLHDFDKGNQSIWIILAAYAEHVLKTETVAFDRES